MDSHLSRIRSRIGMEFSKIKPLVSQMSVPHRKIILESKLRSHIDYGLPIFLGENQQLKDKLETTYMSVNKLIRGGVTYKVNNTKICKEIKSELPAQHMKKTAALFIHKHLNHQKCPSILNQLVIPKRKASWLYVRSPQLGTYNASFDKCVELYNRVPSNVQEMTVRQFKKYYKKNDLKPS